MELLVKNFEEDSLVEPMTVRSDLFDRPYNESLIHQVVVAYMAGARQGTKAQKTRAEVRGGGAKPWRQKGSGRARAGTSRSPIWRKGGVIFAAKPRDFRQKVNRKMYRSALSSIVSQLIRTERLKVYKDIRVPSISTRWAARKLSEKGFRSALIVTTLDDSDAAFDLYFSLRNIPNISYCPVENITPYDLVRFEHVLMTAPAVRALEEQWS